MPKHKIYSFGTEIHLTGINGFALYSMVHTDLEPFKGLLKVDCDRFKDTF